MHRASMPYRCPTAHDGPARPRAAAALGHAHPADRVSGGAAHDRARRPVLQCASTSPPSAGPSPKVCVASISTLASSATSLTRRKSLRHIKVTPQAGDLSCCWTFIRFLTIRCTCDLIKEIAQSYDELPRTLVLVSHALPVRRSSATSAPASTCGFPTATES